MAKSWIDSLSELCDSGDSARVLIELDNGFQVSGVGDFETLRLLYRDPGPGNLSQVISADCEGPVAIVLPTGRVCRAKCDILRGPPPSPPSDCGNTP